MAFLGYKETANSGHMVSDSQFNNWKAVQWAPQDSTDCWLPIQLIILWRVTCWTSIELHEPIP